MPALSGGPAALDATIGAGWQAFPPPASPIPAPAPTPPAGLPGPWRVLLIDDNPDDRALVLRVLQREFPEIDVREIIDRSGFEAALRHSQFELVITDYQLRWTDGLSVLTAVKGRCPDCPTIMFTNSGNEEIAVTAMKAGLDDYIIKKPSHFARLPAAVRAAQQRLEVRRRAADLETRLQTLLNRLNLGVFRATLDGRLLECNPAFLRLLGVGSLADAHALDLRELRLRPQESEQLLSLLADYGALPEREVLLHRADQRPVWILLGQALTRLEHEIVIDGLAEDIGSRRQAQDEIARLNADLEQRVRERTAQLEAANQELDAFSYSVSHDLRAPLRHIGGFADLLEERAAPLLDEESAHYVRTIAESAARARQMVDDLLAFSRAGRADIHPRLVNVRQLAEELRLELAPETGGREIIWNIADPPDVLGDPAQLRLALRNLLANAIKFTRPRNPAHIAIGGARHPDQSVVFVRDDGVGFDARYADKLFGVFQRLHSEREFEGSGVGLAIVRRIIQRHGGRVWAESSVDAGATFYMALPSAAQGTNACTN